MIMAEDNKMIKGSHILMRALKEVGVQVIWGYPGGQIMPVYDALYDYQDTFRHILVRHEQGAIHAAQGYARVSGKTGVVLVTSGPGATNVMTGIADAMIDSTPVVVISGQVGNNMLGTDAFQEADVIGLSTPVTKWCYQIRRPQDIAPAVAKAFYIASSGRPGPVLLDITRDAQVGLAEYHFDICTSIRSYRPCPPMPEKDVRTAAEMIARADRPLLIYGQGITLSGAEDALKAFLDKTGIPATSTLLGLSALPSNYKHFIGMAGMHGNIAPNVMTQKCDLLIAIGMRFDDRVTCKMSEYAKQARKIHIDIDEAEIGKNIRVDLGVHGDAKAVLERLTELVPSSDYTEWEMVATKCHEAEVKEVIDPEIHPTEGPVTMGEVINTVADVVKDSAIVITDVGQNQMLGARYSRFNHKRSLITSGGLGTMGFGLPAAIGAKVASPDRQVCLFVGDGGLQMTIQELGTIMQEGTGVKIVVLNNNWLGNVRQWQQLFWKSRYSFTRLMNPDFKAITEAYGIKYLRVSDREHLVEAVQQMIDEPGPCLLEACVLEEGMVFPMIAPGKSVDDIMVTKDKLFVYGE